MTKIFIGICGNIGAGKTTLSEFLSRPNGALRKFGDIKVFREDVTKNPYLKLYYENPKRWAFESQMSFLSQRLIQRRNIRDFDGVSISDRTIYEDGYVFASSLHDQGILNDLGFENYNFWFNFVINGFRKPDVLVYLRIKDINVLLERIKVRGREYEKGITFEYLEGLNRKYEDWMNSWDGEKLIINAEEDMHENPNYMENVEKRIMEKLNGKE